MMPKACTCHALGCCTYYGWQPVVTMARVSGWFYGIKQGIGGSQQPWRFLSCSKGMPLGQPRQSRAGTLWIVPAECFGCLTVAGTVPCLYVQRCQTANMPMHASIRQGSIWASCTTLAQGLAECHEASSPLGKCIPRSLGQPRQHSTFGSIPGSACS